ncbi:17005_t:CDS:1, partial [Gigaspora margarita]
MPGSISTSAVPLSSPSTLPNETTDEIADCYLLCPCLCCQSKGFNVLVYWHCFWCQKDNVQNKVQLSSDGQLSCTICSRRFFITYQCFSCESCHKIEKVSTYHMYPNWLDILLLEKIIYTFQRTINIVPDDELDYHTQFEDYKEGILVPALDILRQEYFNKCHLYYIKYPFQENEK